MTDMIFNIYSHESVYYLCDDVIQSQLIKNQFNNYAKGKFNLITQHYARMIWLILEAVMDESSNPSLQYSSTVCVNEDFYFHRP